MYVYKTILRLKIKQQRENYICKPVIRTITSLSWIGSPNYFDYLVYHLHKFLFSKVTYFEKQFICFVELHVIISILLHMFIYYTIKAIQAYSHSVSFFAAFMDKRRIHKDEPQKSRKSVISTTKVSSSYFHFYVLILHSLWNIITKSEAIR